MRHLFHKIGYSLRHWSEVGVTMQRKLTVYFACTVLVVFVAAVVLIRTAGIMPGSERNLGETLAVQHQNTFSAMTKQMDLLTARSMHDIFEMADRFQTKCGICDSARIYASEAGSF